MDVIYAQAKKWEGTVGRLENQKFACALRCQMADKEVFITTSSFTCGAKEYAGVLASKVFSKDGDQLVDLMVDCGFAVSTLSTFHTTKIDSDHFESDTI